MKSSRGLVPNLNIEYRRRANIIRNSKSLPISTNSSPDPNPVLVDPSIVETVQIQNEEKKVSEEVFMKQELTENDDQSSYEDGYLSDSTNENDISDSKSRAHARSLRAMSNPSAVWAHFDLCPEDPLRAQCRICGIEVVRGGANPRQCGTTNLHRHLRVHHGARLVGRRYLVSRNIINDSTQDLDMDLLEDDNAFEFETNTLLRQLQNESQNLESTEVENELDCQSQYPPPSERSLILRNLPFKLKQISPNSLKISNQQIPLEVPRMKSQSTISQPTEVCLRWNSYHSNMQNSFPSLLDNGQFVDVTLACEGQSLKCHKMILSSCSDYLAHLLKENPCQHPVIIMKDLKFWEVEALVKFMYRGEIHVAQDKLPELLNAAEALQVKGLAGPSIPQNSKSSSKPLISVPQTKKIVPRKFITQIENDRKTNPSATTMKNTEPVKSAEKQSLKRSQIFDFGSRTWTKVRIQQPSTVQTKQFTGFQNGILEIPQLSSKKKIKLLKIEDDSQQSISKEQETEVKPSSNLLDVKPIGIKNMNDENNEMIEMEIDNRDESKSSQELQDENFKEKLPIFLQTPLNNIGAETDAEFNKLLEEVQTETEQNLVESEPGEYREIDIEMPRGNEIEGCENEIGELGETEVGELIETEVENEDVSQSIEEYHEEVDIYMNHDNPMFLSNDFIK